MNAALIHESNSLHIKQEETIKILNVIIHQRFGYRNEALYSFINNLLQKMNQNKSAKSIILIFTFGSSLCTSYKDTLDKHEIECIALIGLCKHTEVMKAVLV